MDIGALSSVAIAKLDLKLVQLLRGAMFAADIQGAHVLSGACRPWRNCLRPLPIIEPRPVLHPTPRIEPRPVLHPTPIIVQDTVEISGGCAPPNSSPAPLEKSPIQPPWRVLPWQIPVPPPAQVKIVLYKPDIVSKGTLLDSFI